MKRKIFNVLLTVLMVLSFLPTTIKASETVHITYDINGGTGVTPVDTNEYEPFETIYLASPDDEENEFSNDPYVFLYWSTNKDYVEGEERYHWYTYDLDEDTTLYARWGYELTVVYSDNYLDEYNAAFTSRSMYHVNENADIYDFIKEELWDEEDDCWNSDDFTAFTVDGYTTDKNNLIDIVDNEFYMSDNTTIYAKLINHKTSIIIESCENGYITTTKEEAFGDETFDINVYPDDGYILNNIKACYDSGWMTSTVWWEPDTVDQVEFKDVTNQYSELTLTPCFGKIYKASDIVKAGAKGININAGDYILMDIDEIEELTVYSMEAAICLDMFENFSSQDFVDQGGDLDELHDNAYRYTYTRQYWTPYVLEVDEYCKVQDYYCEAVNIYDEMYTYSISAEKYNVTIDEDGNITLVSHSNEYVMIDAVNGEINGKRSIDLVQGKSNGLTIHINSLELDEWYDWWNENYSYIVVKNGSTTLTEGVDYEIKEGSVIVDFKEDYINSLKVGKYDLTIEFIDSWLEETAYTFDFSLNIVNAVPNTGINDNFLKTISLFSLVGIIAVMFVKKKD